jgi:DNA-binding IclR family transcriptional regulator
MNPKSQTNSNQRYHIRAVARALVLLKTFLGNETELGAVEIGKRIDLDPSTTFRMLVTLESYGFVKQDPTTGKYRLGVSCLELGSQFLKHNDIRKAALEAMGALRDQFGETVHLGVLDHTEIVYLEKVPGLHAIGLMSSRVGGRAPAHATAIGKVLLAHLPADELGARMPRGKLSRCTPNTITDWRALAKELARVREQGFALDNQEFEAGVKCVAVPIFSHKGIAAALSISAPAERMNNHIAKHGLDHALKKAAADISGEVGWGRGVDQVGTQNDLRARWTKSKTRMRGNPKRPRTVRER